MSTTRPSLLRLVLAAACLTIACSDLTEVKDPSVVEPESLDNPTGAVARYAGAIRLFTGFFQSAANTSGTFVDELIGTENVGNDAESFLVDPRRPFTQGFPTTRSTNFTSASAALVNFGYATEAMLKFAPTPGSRIGHLFAFSGYIELLLAEEYCNGIPMSTITSDGVVSYGSGTPTTAVYARALAHFDSAIVLAADSARILNLARVGKGRTLLDLGRYADAAAAVASVPNTYSFAPDFSSTVTAQYNNIWTSITTSRAKGVADRDGIVGLNFRTANDPRVPTVYIGIGADNVSQRYNYAPFTGYQSPITLASGTEARLIEAEAALQANKTDAATTGTGWLGRLNALRATAITPALPPLADPGTFDARVDLLMRERAFWMFLTTHRMADVRRLVRQYGRAVNTVYPSGNWRDGLPFGNEVDFDVPLSEAPNASFKGCTSRGA